MSIYKNIEREIAAFEFLPQTQEDYGKYKNQLWNSICKISVAILAAQKDMQILKDREEELIAAKDRLYRLHRKLEELMN